MLLHTTSNEVFLPKKKNLLTIKKEVLEGEVDRPVFVKTTGFSQVSVSTLLLRRRLSEHVLAMGVASLRSEPSQSVTCNFY